MTIDKPRRHRHRARVYRPEKDTNNGDEDCVGNGVRDSPDEDLENY